MLQKIGRRDFTYLDIDITFVRKVMSSRQIFTINSCPFVCLYRFPLEDLQWEFLPLELHLRESMQFLLLFFQFDFCREDNQ